MAGGRPPGPTGKPRPPGTGRKKGSLDKGARTLVTAEMAADILNVYQMLGGVAFLHAWAVDNPSMFVNGPLARLMPPPPKGEEDAPLVNIQLGDTPSLDVARRVAFVLAAGAADLGNDDPAHNIPYSQLADQPVPTEDVDDE